MDELNDANSTFDISKSSYKSVAKRENYGFDEAERIIEQVISPQKSSQYSKKLLNLAKERVKIAGLPFSPINTSDAVELIVEGMNIGIGGVVVTPNLDIARVSRSNAWLRRFIMAADLVTADGSMIVWASRLQKTPVPERVAGSDLSMKLCERLSQTSLSVFLLGGDPGVAATASAKLIADYPGLKIAGVYSPPIGFERSIEQCEIIKTALQSAKPNLVLVGLGCPKQEKLISQLRYIFPETWWIGVGITFSFISGDVRRAPLIVQRAGFEWLWRLSQEPKRLAKRYLIDGIPFAFVVLSQSAALRVMSKCKRIRAGVLQKSQRP